MNQRKGLRISCDVGEAMEGLDNEQSVIYYGSQGDVGEVTEWVKN